MSIANLHFSLIFIRVRHPLNICKQNLRAAIDKVDYRSIAVISTRRALRVSLRNLKYEILNLACVLIAQTVSISPTEQRHLSILLRECLAPIVRCSGRHKDAFYAHPDVQTVPAVQQDRPREYRET